MSRIHSLTAAVMLAAAVATPVYDHAAVMPRRQAETRPKQDRDERKHRQRRFGSLPKRRIHTLNRAYVAHERGGREDRALCLRIIQGNGGTHRFAVGEPIMCNHCQRERWALDQKARGRAK